MNLRVILLKKTTLLHKDQFTKKLLLGTSDLKPWVTMGHFDAMYSYQLDTKNRNIFAVIHKNNSDVASMNNEDNYYHPLYLLTNQDDTDFWQIDSWFMAVTRIHLASTIMNPNEIEKIRQYISSQCKAAGCYSHVYQTIELSDLTMVVKSNCISKMLSVILNLWSRPNIGKLYTYCGVDYGHLKKVDIQPEDDTIDFLSMRFAVRNSHNADSFFQIVKDELSAEHVYSVAGVDDAVLNFSSLSVQNFVSFLRHWLVTGLPKNINLKLIFSDITTRLGANYQKYDPNEESPQSMDFKKQKPLPPKLRSLDQLCAELVKLCTKVHKLAKGKLDSPIDAYWLRSFSELSYSLLRLSRTAPLDEFVYLMLPGVKSFLYNIKDILSNADQERLECLNKERLCLFVDNWSHLMEHVMRLEGQLAHQPETRPILYDIPLAMLEHTLALLDLSSQILQNKDKPKKEIQFILFPKLCSIIEAEEMFVANSPLPGLLSIRIPLHMMYDPQTIQIALCHEIAHFVGENHRNRKLRRDCYIRAAAILMADLIFNTEHEGLTEQINKSLKEHFYNLEMQPETISDVEEEVQIWIDRLLYDATSEKYCNLIRNTLKNTVPGMERKKLEFSADFVNLQERNVRYFAEVLPKLTTLFREVFADICMVCLLNLDADVYLDSLYKGVLEKPDSVEFTAVRIFTTLSAVKKRIPERLNRSNDEVGEQFSFSVQRLKAGRSNWDTISKTYRFPINCVKQLQIYSDKCAADIEDLLKDDEVKEMVVKLQKMYSNVVSTNMDYSLLREFIDDYRKRILQIGKCT